MATPLVSGLVALLLSYAKEHGLTYTPTEIKAILQQTAENADVETACQCRVSAKGALQNLAENSLTMVPFALTLESKKTHQMQGIGGEEGYEFSSSDDSIASITPEGSLTAKANGQVKITVQDQAGKIVTSDRIFIGKTENKNQCPFQSPIFCQIFCAYDPTLPWCSNKMLSSDKSSSTFFLSNL
jgi:thermitase